MVPALEIVAENYLQIIQHGSFARPLDSFVRPSKQSKSKLAVLLAASLRSTKAISKLLRVRLTVNGWLDLLKDFAPTSDVSAELAGNSFEMLVTRTLSKEQAAENRQRRIALRKRESQISVEACSAPFDDVSNVALLDPAACEHKTNHQGAPNSLANIRHESISDPGIKMPSRRADIADAMNRSVSARVDGRGSACLDPKAVAAVKEFASTGAVSVSGRRVSGGSPTLVPHFVTDSGFPAGSTDFPPYGIVSLMNRRKEMEDAVAAIPDFAGGLNYFAVFDGHGGNQAARICASRLHVALKEELVAQLRAPAAQRAFLDRASVALANAFSRTNSEIAAFFHKSSPNMCSTVGSTAVVALLSPIELIVANCGDSRAVLCHAGKAVQLSVDHKPERPDEHARIEALGGRVIFMNGYRVMGILAMSRSMGDQYLHPYVTCEPEIISMSRHKADEFMILASDGLWDVVSSEEACRVARGCLVARPDLRPDGTASTMAAALLSKMAMERGSADNVSVVVVDLALRLQ